jgi:hypothetical protein
MEVFSSNVNAVERSSDKLTVLASIDRSRPFCSQITLLNVEERENFDWRTTLAVQFQDKVI